MAFPKNQRQAHLSLGLISVMCVVLGLVACNASWTTDITGTPVPTSGPTATPIPPAPHRIVVFCDDETGSYSISNFKQAAIQFASWVRNLERPNTSGASVYVQWINSNSYQDSSTYLAFEAPPIPQQPAVPGPVPTEIPLHTNENATAFAGATDTAVTYATAAPVWQSQFAQAKATIDGASAKIQRMPYQEAFSSDIWGCLQRATERFAERPSDAKFLVIASDMQPVGLQEVGPVRLYGASVTIIYFETSQVGVADQYKSYWTAHIKAAGGETPVFYRPSDILPQQLF